MCTKVKEVICFAWIGKMEEYGTRKHTSLEDRAAAESVVERVYLAVENLCVGEGDVRSRLKISIATLMPLQAQEFPQELQEDFRWIIFESTKFDSEIPSYEGALGATMRRIRNSTGVKIACRIFKIYSEIQNIRGFPLLDYRHPKD